MNQVRSPLFYVGDKYKLMPQLTKLFPHNIKTFYDVFAGGGSASLNTVANKYVLNDIDSHIMGLHKYLAAELQEPEKFFEHELNIIDDYGLSHSAENVYPRNIKDLKAKYKKTYFSKANKSAYIKLRDAYNYDNSRMDLLYLLLVFGFNHMTRFNSSGMFNLPVGNVDWNSNVEAALKLYANFVNTLSVEYNCEDFETFVNDISFNKGDFLYFDPPYLITFSEYNKLWNHETDLRLFRLLDALSKTDINWGLSNVLSHKGRKNEMLREWAARYNVYPIKSNYISKFDNTIKEDTKEVYITNYKFKE